MLHPKLLTSPSKTHQWASKSLSFSLNLFGLGNLPKRASASHSHQPHLELEAAQEHVRFKACGLSCSCVLWSWWLTLYLGSSWTSTYTEVSLGSCRFLWSWSYRLVVRFEYLLHLAVKMLSCLTQRKLDLAIADCLQMATSWKWQPVARNPTWLWQWDSPSRGFFANDFPASPNSTNCNFGRPQLWARFTRTPKNRMSHDSCCLAAHLDLGAKIGGCEAACQIPPFVT